MSTRCLRTWTAALAAVVLIPLFAVSSASASSASHENITIDGNLADLITAVNNNLGASNGGFTFSDNLGDIYTGPCAFVNGYDVRQGYVLFDFKDAQGNYTPDDVTVYVGFQVEGVIGDTDGDGDPDAFTPGSPGRSSGCSLSDLAGIGAGEAYSLNVDLNCDNNTDLRLGVTENQLGKISAGGGLLGAISGAFARSGAFLEIRIDNYQDLVANSGVTGADLCDAKFRLFANALEDGPGEDNTDTQTLEVPPSIDVEKTPATQDACPNSPVPFTITVTNDGLCHLDVVTVTDVLPAGLTFVSSNPASTGDAQNRSWSLPAMDPGDVVVITLNAQVAGTCVSAVLTNNVTVEGTHNSVCRDVGTTATDNASADVNCTQPTCEISGPTPVCAGSQNLLYTVTSSTQGATFSWAISGNGTINGSTTGSQVDVTAGAAGSFTLTVTVTADGCTNTCTKTVTVVGNPTCEITGPPSICSDTPTTYNVTSNVQGATFTWSITGNGTINGSNTGSSVSVTGTGTGSFTLTVVVEVDGCTGTCNLTVQTAPCGGICRMTGGGCFNDGDKKGHKHHTFGGNVGPIGGPSGGSWEHIVRDGRETEFNFHSFDPHTTSCTLDGGDGPCSPGAANNIIEWEGTGVYSIGSGARTEDAYFTARVEDRGEPGSHDGHCGSKDFYTITVYNADTDAIVFHMEGYIDCGNLQIHDMPPNYTPPTQQGPEIGEVADGAGVALLQAYPNPFTSSMSYSYRVANGSESVDIGVYNVAGRLLSRLAAGSQAPGTYTVRWNGTSTDGARVAPGIYFIRARVGSEVSKTRVMFLP